MELGDLKQLRDLYHLEVVAAVACEGRPGAFLVAVVVAVIGVVVVVIAAGVRLRRAELLAAAC